LRRLLIDIYTAPSCYNYLCRYTRVRVSVKLYIIGLWRVARGPSERSCHSVSLRHPALSSSVRLTSSEQYADRRRVFGDNHLPEKKAKNLFQIIWITFNDKVLIILTTIAAISLVLGLYQDFGENTSGPKVRWVEGVTIMLTVIIVVVVRSINDYQKERQFVKLNKMVRNMPHA
jgi:magnesium-transporting ATPase (P-type)